MSDGNLSEVEVELINARKEALGYSLDYLTDGILQGAVGPDEVVDVARLFTNFILEGLVKVEVINNAPNLDE